MTAGQFPWRLYWAGFRGVMRVGGHETRLERCPAIAGQQFEGVDYVPELVAQVMPRGERWRDMLPAEIQAARELLGLDDGTVCVVVDTCRRGMR